MSAPRYFANDRQLFDAWIAGYRDGAVDGSNDDSRSEASLKAFFDEWLAEYWAECKAESAALNPVPAQEKREDET